MKGVESLVGALAAVLVVIALAGVAMGVTEAVVSSLRTEGNAAPEDIWQRLIVEDVAYLAGESRRAVLTAVAHLRATGAVEAAAGQLRATGHAPGEVGPVAAAIHAWVDKAPQTGRTVADSPPVRAALQAAEQRLTSEALLIKRRDVDGVLSIRRGILVAAGFLAIVAFACTDHGVLALLTALATGLVGALTWHRLRPTPHTNRGTKTLTRLREHYRRLAPDTAARRLDPPELAMAVALHGVTAMRATDPAFVEQLELPRPAPRWSAGVGVFAGVSAGQKVEDHGDGIRWDSSGWSEGAWSGGESGAGGGGWGSGGGDGGGGWSGGDGGSGGGGGGGGGGGI